MISTCTLGSIDMLIHTVVFDGRLDKYLFLAEMRMKKRWGVWFVQSKSKRCDLVPSFPRTDLTAPVILSSLDALSAILYVH